MTIDERIRAFEELSRHLQDVLSNKSGNEKLRQQIENEQHYNAWFIPVFVRQAIDAIARMLDKHQIKDWIEPYRERLSSQKAVRVGVIMAGNIPLVGFHDFLCVLISGHVFVGKLSSHDANLLPLIAEILCEIEPRFKEKILFCEEKLSPVERIIATGSNNTARHFSYYFQQYPTIIRKHCNSVAILEGNESDEALKGLADDICLYFGLGCRSVSKIYVPEHYSFHRLFSALDNYKNIFSQHHKYLNNLEYQKTVHLLNASPFLDQGIIMLKENNALSSPIGIVHYQYYKNRESVSEETDSQGNALQCISCHKNGFVPLGQTQFPKLDNYANGINTLLFLSQKPAP
ncbi:MAG: hypothetical protein LBI60_03515 [Bacteroidales bacterium]|jgi:hypothetical protein|nr:hypothetical protein [Bacteroidales bacterium]